MKTIRLAILALALLLTGAAQAQCLQNPDGSCMGQWQNVPFNASDFSAPVGGFWTVAANNVMTHKYAIVGKTMTVAFYIVGTTITGGLYNDLFLRIPGGKVATGVFVNALLMVNGGHQMAGMVYTVGNSQWLTISRSDDALFQQGSWFYVFGEISFEIQ